MPLHEAIRRSTDCRSIGAGGCPATLSRALKEMAANGAFDWSMACTCQWFATASWRCAQGAGSPSAKPFVLGTAASQDRRSEYSPRKNGAHTCIEFGGDPVIVKALDQRW